MIGLILICHGRLAETLVATAEQIVGPLEGVHPISNEGKAPELIRRELEEAFSSFEGSEGVLVMVDLFGSSCWRCGMEWAHRNVAPNTPVALISGINLGTILSFSYKRHKMGLRELAQAMAQDAHRGVHGPVFFPRGNA